MRITYVFAVFFVTFQRFILIIIFSSYRENVPTFYFVIRLKSFYHFFHYLIFYVPYVKFYFQAKWFFYLKVFFGLISLKYKNLFTLKKIPYDEYIFNLSAFGCIYCCFHFHCFENNNGFVFLNILTNIFFNFKYISC